MIFTFETHMATTSSKWPVVMLCSFQIYWKIFRMFQDLLRERTDTRTYWLTLHTDFTHNFREVGRICKWAAADIILSYLLHIQTVNARRVQWHWYPDNRVWRSYLFNPLTSNDHYSVRTAPLTSKRYIYIFIQQIQVLNILNMVYTLRFFLFKMQFVS